MRSIWKAPMPEASERGFTSLELLVVALIIFVVGGITIRCVQTYRTSSYDTMALQNLHDALTAQEAYYAKQENYLTCIGTDCLSEMPELRISDSVHLGFRVQEEVGEDSIVGVSCSTKGSLNGKSFFRVVQVSAAQQFSQVQYDRECSDDSIETILNADAETEAT